MKNYELSAKHIKTTKNNAIKQKFSKTTQFNEIYMESFGGEKGTKKKKRRKLLVELRNP